MSPPQRRKRRRLLLPAIAALVVIVGGWYGYKALYPTKRADFMTATAAKGDVELTVLATGIVKPSRLVAVGAQVSGRITAVKVALGQEVKKGDLIATIDSVTQQNSLKTAEASLDNVKAQKAEKEATLVSAQAALDRETRTLAQKASSMADFETATATVATTKAQIAALDAQIVEAQVSVDTAKVNVGYTEITAPVDGTVLAVVSQEGQTVNANQTTPTIAILGQLDSMVVRAQISEADVVRVAPGQSVYFTILGDPDRRFPAKLESIEPAPESITSDSSVSTSSASSSSSSSSTNAAIYYNGILHVDNKDRRLRTYMTAEVHIILGEAKGVVTIPSPALGNKRADGKYTIRVLGADGTPERREVEVGLDNKTLAEIKSGLNEGERVITGQLAPGAAPQTSMRRGPPMGF